jgi:hypothetical protein
MPIYLDGFLDRMRDFSGQAVWPFRDLRRSGGLADNKMFSERMTEIP